MGGQVTMRIQTIPSSSSSNLRAPTAEEDNAFSSVCPLVVLCLNCADYLLIQPGASSSLEVLPSESSPDQAPSNEGSKAGLSVDQYFLSPKNEWRNLVCRKALNLSDKQYDEIKKLAAAIERDTRRGIHVHGVVLKPTKKGRQSWISYDDEARQQELMQKLKIGSVGEHCLRIAETVKPNGFVVSVELSKVAYSPRVYVRPAFVEVFPMTQIVTRASSSNMEGPSKTRNVALDLLINQQEQKVPRVPPLQSNQSQLEAAFAATEQTRQNNRRQQLNGLLNKDKELEEMVRTDLAVIFFDLLTFLFRLSVLNTP
jgi:hypothetical protein